MMKYCAAILVFLRVITIPHQPYADWYFQPIVQACLEAAYTECQAEPRIAPDLIMADIVTMIRKLEKAQTVLSLE